MHAWQPDGAGLRRIGLKLQDLASRCQFPSIRLELRGLAVQFERRAGHLDDVTEQSSVLPGVRWTQFYLSDKEISALRKLLADAIEYHRFPLSLRIQALQCILAKFGPLPIAGPVEAFPVQDDFGAPGVGGHLDQPLVGFESNTARTPRTEG